MALHRVSCSHGFPESSPPCGAGRTCCSAQQGGLAGSGHSVLETLSLLCNCQPLPSSALPRSRALPCPGLPIPPVMTLAVSSPLCQPIQQRCLLAAIQRVHTPPRSTLDKGKHLTKLGLSPQEIRTLYPAVAMGQPLTACWETVTSLLIHYTAFVRGEMAIQNFRLGFYWR